MLATLIAEHAQLRKHIAELRALRAASNASLEKPLADFKLSIQTHFQKEESHYRVLDQETDTEMRPFIHHLRNDHAAVLFGVESLIIRLRKLGPVTEWWDHFEKLMGVFEPHMIREENELFPGAF